MSALEVAVHLVIALARHPATQTLAKHALRNATASILRQVRHRSRASTGTIHFS